MTTCFTATPGVDVITTTADIPALGSLAINAFVLHGTEPVLVDTGTVAGAPEFLTALASVIDPADLRIDAGTGLNAAVSVAVDEDRRITRIYVVANPDKLARLDGVTALARS